MSLFYPDVVIGRPGARCDALEAQNMIVCIPGARRCYQRTGRVDLGCWIYVHNLRDCAKMGEMVRGFALHSMSHTSSVAPITYHLSPITSSVAHSSTPITSSVGPSHTIPRTLHLTPHASSVSPSHTIPRTLHPLPRASARRNKRLLWQICRFLRYPKLGAQARWGVGAPVNDNYSPT